MTPEQTPGQTPEQTPEQLGAALADRVDGSSYEVAFGDVHVDVPDVRWVEGHELARHEFGLVFFDWLSAYDDRDAGLAVVSRLWSVADRRGVVLRTRVPRDAPRLPSLVEVFRGANWHERETFEMFGIVFDGHPLLVPLLLPDGFEGHPLRKEFVLASRAAKAWPGAKEPGESEHEGVRTRRRMQPTGVPDEGWGGDWR